MNRTAPVPVAKSLEEILAKFEAQPASPGSLRLNGKPVTLWLPVPYKTKFDRTQTATNRRFCKLWREVTMFLLDHFDSGAEKAS